MRLAAIGSLVTIAVVLGGCTVGHQVLKVPQLDKNSVPRNFDQAAYYALPRTVVVVSTPVKKSFVLKGLGKSGDPATSCFDQLDKNISEKFKKAIPAWVDNPPEKLLGAVGLREKPDLTAIAFEATGAPTIGTMAEPDPGQVFRVELGSKWSQKRELKLKFGPLGTLQSGMSFVQDRRVDLAVAFAKTVLSVGTQFLTMSVARQPRLEIDLEKYRASLDEEKPVDFRCGVVIDDCERAACEILHARSGLARLPLQVVKSKASTFESRQWWACRSREAERKSPRTKSSGSAGFCCRPAQAKNLPVEV